MTECVQKFYTQVLKVLFPPVKYCFAYGSAAFIQKGRSKVSLSLGILYLFLNTEIS